MSRIEFADGQGLLEYDYLAKIILEEYNDKATDYLATRNYRSLMATKIWAEARDFVVDIKKDKDGKLYCGHCGEEMTVEVTVFMHHEHYLNKDIFDLNSISVICRTCNAKAHHKKWRK